MKKFISALIGTIVVIIFCWILFQTGLENGLKYYHSLLTAYMVGVFLELVVLWLVYIININNYK